MSFFKRVIYLLIQSALSAVTLCERLNTQPFMPEISRQAYYNYKHQTYHQWPSPMSLEYMGIQTLLNNRNHSRLEPLDVALKFADLFLSSRTNLTYIVKDSYRTNFTGVTHIYLRQVLNGFEVTEL